MSSGKDRRQWTAEQKLQAVLPIIRGEVTLAEQARRLKMSETQLYKWRDQANEGLRQAFTTGASSREKELEQQVADLERLCGKQAVEIDVLKKTRLV